MSAGPVLRLDLEYDGAAFYGWAAQPGLRTVEGVLTEALRTFWPRSGRPAVAGRTDTGVHASGQVVTVEAAEGGPELTRVPAALNAHLPPDVAVLGCTRAPEGFHARFSARSRSYQYRVLRSRAPSPLRAACTWHWPREISQEVLGECAALLLGEHDFRAFTPAETQHEVFRRIVLEAGWEREGDELVFRVEADSFLRHMVRTLVGTMIQTAGGERPPEAFASLLEGSPRAAAGVTAPPHALCLVGVRY
ncbi:MAG TPA: tRNA pseudouridine(38-40) synthase TruA [Gaiellales bacterium]|nr:tRNA pseudouridine(38-40) synthase TruA [Gaiellales bacterium]